MTENNNKSANSDRWLNDFRYYSYIGALAITLCAIQMTLLPLHAADNWEVEGANGTLHIQGVLTESACRLEMNSARQDIWLGETGTAQLSFPGERASPVAFELRLTDCLRNSASQRDERTGARYWATIQPTVSVSFSAPADMDNPQLIRADGVSGLGLRLLDGNGHDVRLGSRGAPLFLAPGQDSLTYTVTTERTPAPLVAGAYRAAVDFQLSYN